MYTIGHHNNVYPGYIRLRIQLVNREVTSMYTIGHHNNVYPGNIRYYEYS